MSGQKKLTPGASRRSHKKKEKVEVVPVVAHNRIPPPDARFKVEYGEFPIVATAKIVDATRQQPTAYLVSPDGAQRVSLGMNHLEEFRSVAKTAVTMRDIIDNMIAMEEVDDMDGLTKICDRNRILLERMEIGPFMPASRSEGYRTLDPEDAAYEKHALAPKDPPTYVEAAIKEISKDEDDDFSYSGGEN